MLAIFLIDAVKLSGRQLTLLIMLQKRRNGPVVPSDDQSVEKNYRSLIIHTTFFFTIVGSSNFVLC